MLKKVYLQGKLADLGVMSLTHLLDFRMIIGLPFTLEQLTGVIQNVLQHL